MSTLFCRNCLHLVPGTFLAPNIPTTYLSSVLSADARHLWDKFNWPEVVASTGLYVYRHRRARDLPVELEQLQ